MKKLLLIFIFTSFTYDANALVEVKSNLFASFLSFGRSEIIATTHNTVLLGFDSFKAGAFYSYEKFQENTQDSSLGAAIRFGEKTFFEIQAGAYTRKFTSHTTITGKGLIANLIIGKHFGDYFGLSLYLTAKKITSGMDKRTMIKALPYLGFRIGF